MIFIYAWNRLIVKNIIKHINRFHKRNNAKNLNKQPVKSMIQNERIIYIYTAAFYWGAAILISIGILTEN